MNYPEFNKYKEEFDNKNPYSKKYILDDGSMFYIEPAFYTQLIGFKTYRPESFEKILNEIERLVRKNKKVVFVGNFEFPQTEVDQFIFLEITDVTDPLKIFVEDKSRGSDYGD